MNNKTLLIVFSACLVVFVSSQLLRKNRTSTFNPEIIKVDSAKIDRIVFASGGPQPEQFELKRNGQQWEAVKGDMKVPAAEKNVSSILGQLAHLMAKRIVTRDPNKYTEYEIDDAHGSKVTVYENGKEVSVIEAGGFRFDQASRTATSFMKLNAKPEVYEVDGFLSMGLNARFDQFRDKKVVKASAEDLTSVEWSDPMNHKQTITKEDGRWHYAGMEAVDSSKFNAYLTALAGAQGNEFSELKNTSGLNLIEKITLYGNNMESPTVISAFSTPDTLKPFLIASSANPDAVFKSDSSGLYKRIFLDLRPFWPNGK